MVGRILAVAMNAYREAVRARVLYGLLAAALATCAYSLLVATLSLHQEARVVANLGAASISLYGVLVAIVLGATSLHREIELKTVFPILTRTLRRHEYIVGKYLGTLLTLAVFVALDASVVFGLLSLETGQRPARVLTALGALGAVLSFAWLRARHARVFVVLPWSAALWVVMYLLAQTAGDERRLVAASCALALSEVAIVAAVATLFSSFSSPFLTAVFTLGVFIVGRSADTLANLPERVLGDGVRKTGQILARVVPNLQIYAPPRPLLLDHVSGTPVWPFVASGAAHALLYATVLVTLSALIFRKRDFL